MPRQYMKEEVNQLIFAVAENAKKESGLTAEEIAELDRKALFLTSEENLDDIQLILNKLEDGDKDLLKAAIEFFAKKYTDK